MELNITEFYNKANPFDFSSSVIERGENAGTVTWHNALEASGDYTILDNEEKKEAFKDHVKGFGAWDDEEIAAWSDAELEALLLQLISGDIRESCLDDDSEAWDEYENEAKMGQISGRLFKGTDGEIYYYIGS